MGRKQRGSSSSAESMAVERDPTRVPGRPFLEHLHRVLNGHSSEDANESCPAAPALGRTRGASVRQLMVEQHDAAVRRELVINASCLCYLQKLLYAMLTPTKSEYTGMVTQWRLNATFAQQLEQNPDSPVILGAASPERILQLAGRLLEIDTLRLEVLPSEANLPVPSDCDLLVFPKLSRLHLDGVDLSLVQGLAKIADSLVELHYSNGAVQSLASLLAPDLEFPVTKWRNLRSVCVENVSLTSIQVDEAALAPNLETAVIRNAGLNNYGALTRCAWLSVLDLSHNHIYSLDIATGTFEQLRVLNLSHNHLSTIQSLQGCVNLEAINLGYNLILSLEDVRELVHLQQLRSVILLGNPVTRHASYRREARRMLSNEVVLDDTPWTVQEFDEFAGKIDSVRREDAVAEGEKGSLNITKATRSAVSQFNPWLAVRGILRSCVAIGFAQVVVSTAWSRDAEAERLTLWIVVVTAGLAIVSVTLALGVSWLFACFGRQLASLNIAHAHKPDTTHDPALPSESTIQTLSRGFSLKQLTDHDRHLLATEADEILRLDKFSDSLQAAVRSGDDLSLHLLEEVCLQLKTVLAFMSGPGGDGVGFAWLQLTRAVHTFGHKTTGSWDDEELVRERLSSRLSLALNAAEPSTSFPTSLAKILPVIRLVAIVLSSVTSESDLPQVLRDAYVQVFAARHPWWRQRSILSGIATVPGTDAFLDWLSSSRAHNHRQLLETLHKCGERLHFLHAALQDLVDEHTHSFGHHAHPIS